MKRYLAHVKSWGFHGEFEEIKVYEIEIEKETPKMFYYKGHRRPKKYQGTFGEFYSCHETGEEASNALIEYLSEQESRKRQEADLLQREARILRAKIEELEKEN